MNTRTTENEKLKIGIFTDSYRPYVSGVVRSIDILKDELEKKGHELYIFAPNYPLASKEKRVFRYISLPAPTQRNFFLPIPFSPRLPFTVQELELDLIHVHSPFLLGTLGTLIAKLFNLPLVFTYHTLYHYYAHYFPLGKKTTSSFIRKWNKKFCNRCDRIVAPSLFVKMLIKENGVTSPVDVIPTGLNNDFFNLQKDDEWLRNKFNLGTKEKILLYVGRLGKEKNLLFLIDAMEKIIKIAPQTRLVLVGTGPEEPGLRLASRQKGLDSYVLFCGQVNHNELLKCYASADIFTFASQTETQGLVVGEAKAAGLPVVSYYSPCMSEVVFHGKDGFLVHNLQDFISKIIYLLENEAVSKAMGARGKMNTIRYSSNLLAQRMLNSYQKAIRDKKVLNKLST